MTRDEPRRIAVNIAKPSAPAHHQIGTMIGSAPFTLQGAFIMATNNPRHGYERKRSQLKTKPMGQKHWTKRSRKTGEFMDQKKVGKFKSVRREKST